MLHMRFVVFKNRSRKMCMRKFYACPYGS